MLLIGNPMVNPDNLSCGGNPVKGWIVERQSPGAPPLRLSVELYKPGKINEGCVARPLTYADVAAKLEGKPSAQGLQELRKACNMNRNMGNKVINIDFVLTCLKEDG